ncbi:MAG: gamma-glutamyl-gamma-aminobutyrate hydrolase family protein [Thermoleophilia bacterium]
MLTGIGNASTAPVIGICAALEPARWAVWDQPAALVPMNYIEHVQRAGGLALLIPPDPALTERPGEILDRVDALLLVGGPDVGADRYGAEPHPMAEPPVPLRDEVEIALVREARRRGMPMLGICRGMQVINVAGGGSLLQHLPHSHGSDEHRRQAGRFAGNEHGVRLDAGSRVATAEGEAPAEVASHHHQAVDRVGDGFSVTGRAADGVIEAIESTNGSWQVGVQWHPEPDPDSRIIGALVDAARRAGGGS